MEQVILITGASGGMGNAIAEFYCKENVKLALHYNNNTIKTPESGKVQHFQADLTQEVEVERLISEVIEKFGRIDVLINNAGISESSVSWKTKVSSWNDTLAINLSAPFLLAKYTIPCFKAQQSGSIVNITSIVAQTGFIGTSSYAASKAGLIGLTKTLAKELANYGVNVNALALGYFNVGMIEDVPSDIRKEIIESIPLKKLGSPKTVFETIKLLASEEGSYITAQTINLNGGLFS